VRRIRTLEEINKGLENKNKEIKNKLAQSNDRNMEVTKKIKQLTIVRQNVYNIQPDHFKNKIKGSTAGSEILNWSPSKLEDDLKVEKMITQQLHNELIDLRKKLSKPQAQYKSQDIKNLILHYPEQYNLTKDKIDQNIKKFDDFFTKIHRLVDIIKGRNKQARKVISNLYEKYLKGVDYTKAKLNNEAKALEQKVNEVKEQISNQRNKPKSNHLVYVKNSLEKILNITPSGDNIEEFINEVNEAIKKLTAENANLAAECKNLRNGKIALEEKVKELNMTILENRDLIKESSSKIKEKIMEYEKLLTKSFEEFNNLKQKVENLRELNKDLEDKNNSLIEKINNLKKEHEEIKNTLQGEIAKLRRENINLKNELGKSEEKIKQLNDLVSEYKLENIKLKDENKELEQKFYRLDIGQRYNVLEGTKTELNERRRREEKLKEEMNKLKKNYEGLKKIKDEEQKELAAENRFLQGKLEKLRPISAGGPSEELEKEIIELKNALKESEEKIKKQEEEKNELKIKCENLAAESGRKSSRITMLQMDIESLESQVREHEQTIAEYENRQA